MNIYQVKLELVTIANYIEQRDMEYTGARHAWIDTRNEAIEKNLNITVQLLDECRSFWIN
jgi:hypothetical protein